MRALQIVTFVLLSFALLLAVISLYAEMDPEGAAQLARDIQEAMRAAQEMSAK